MNVYSLPNIRSHVTKKETHVMSIKATTDYITLNHIIIAYCPPNLRLIILFKRT